MPYRERGLDNDDLAFVESAITSVQQKERQEGGPRFPDDVIEVVRGLVKTSESLEKSMESLSTTVGSLVKIIDGGIGDRENSLLTRVKKMEDTQKRALNYVRFGAIGIGGVVARVGWATWQDLANWMAHLPAGKP
jgi:hypothetical protein